MFQGPRRAGGSGVEKIGDDIFITFDLHLIRVTLDKIVNIYNNIDQLPRLVSLLVHKVDVIESVDDRKHIVIVLKVPILNILFEIDTRLQILQKESPLAYVFKVDATGDATVEGQAIFYSQDALTSMWAQFKVSHCPFHVVIVRLVYNFIEPIATSLMEAAGKACDMNLVM